jgi:hypothetical protein
MTMKNLRKAKVLVLFTAVAFIFANGASASAANKTITCYKGTIVKKVSAAKPNAVNAIQIARTSTLALITLCDHRATIV